MRNKCYFFTVNNGQIPKNCNHQQIFGVLGVINLLVGPYIVIIKGKKCIGKISGHDIWQLTDVDLIPLPKTMLHLNETQVMG